MRLCDNKVVVICGGTTEEPQIQVDFWGSGVGSGIPSVAVKCVDIRRNNSEEGVFLDNN